jgi:hypothetical protein
MARSLLETSPEDFVEFIEKVKDLKGYLMALMVNFQGAEERVLEHSEYLRKLITGRLENDDPEEMVHHLMQLRGKLVGLVAGYPETEREALPAMRVIDSIFDQVRIET